MNGNGKTFAGEVVVFGATGFFGASLCPALELLGYSVVRQSREARAALSCNPSDSIEVASVLKSSRPIAIINLVALSNVDYCEANVSEAYLANVRSVAAIALAASTMTPRPHLIQVSTDHLYSGAGPHIEESVMPINVYALTKFAGELVALQAGATVLRTNFFGKSLNPQRKSFTDWIYESLISDRRFTVFDDVLFSALNMPTLAKCVAMAIEKKRSGVFNVGARHGISKAAFAQLFASRLGLDTGSMQVGSVRDINLAAPRPQDMRMVVTAFEKMFEFEMPNMAEQINDAADDYRR